MRSYENNQLCEEVSCCSDCCSATAIHLETLETDFEFDLNACGAGCIVENLSDCHTLDSPESCRAGANFVNESKQPFEIANANLCCFTSSLDLAVTGICLENNGENENNVTTIPTFSPTSSPLFPIGPLFPQSNPNEGPGSDTGIDHDREEDGKPFVNSGEQSIVIGAAFAGLATFLLLLFLMIRNQTAKTTTVVHHHVHIVEPKFRRFPTSQSYGEMVIEVESENQKEDELRTKEMEDPSTPTL